MRSISRLGCSLALSLLAAPPVLAHGRLSATTALYPAQGRHPPLIVTTFGLLEPNPSGGWDLTCAEAVGYDEIFDPLVLRSDAGMLVGTRRGLFFSADGCDWKAHGAPAAETGTADLEPVPDGGLLAIGDGMSPGLYASADFRHTWQLLFTASNTVFTTVRIAPSRPQRIYLGGYDSASGAAKIFISDNAGESFETQTLEDAGIGYLELLAVHPSRPGEWVGNLSSVAGSDLMRSTDGGLPLTSLGLLQTKWKSARYSSDGQTLYAAASSTDGLWRFPDGATEGQKLPAPLGNACVTLEGEALGVCGAPALDGWAAARLHPDGGVTPLLKWEDINGPKACPANTLPAQLCPELWPLQQGALGLGPDAGTLDGGDEAPPSADTLPEDGCGCDAGSSAVGLLGALAGLLLRTRKRGAR